VYTSPYSLKWKIQGQTNGQGAGEQAGDPLANSNFKKWTLGLDVEFAMLGRERKTPFVIF
jgi:hypothetical protein